jgi:hypothetical protein
MPAGYRRLGQLVSVSMAGGIVDRRSADARLIERRIE